MLAIGDTVQGEGGWYQGDQRYYKWDVTEDQEWLKVHGPVNKEEFKKLLLEEKSDNAEAD